MLYSHLEVKLVRSVLPMNTKHLQSGLSLALLFLALNSVILPSYALSKAEMRHLAQEHASIRLVDQIRTTMDELFGLDVAGLFARLGYPTEERRILGKTFVIWRLVGAEVEESSFTTLTNTWGSSKTSSRTSSTSRGTSTMEAEVEPKRDFMGRAAPLLKGLTARGSGSSSGSSASQTSDSSMSETSGWGTSETSGEGRAVKYKIECTITLEVGEQNRVKGWEFARGSNLDFCVTVLNIKPSFAQLIDEETVKLKEEKARRKAAKKPAMKARKKAAIVYVIRCEGCKSTTPNPQRTPVTKIAIFPFGSDSECLGESRPKQEHIASTLRTIIQDNNSLKLAYFYYDEASGDPLRNNIDKLWVGGVSRRPYAESIFRLGQERDVDAVLMAWRPSVGPGYCSGRMPPYPIELYLIDVKSQYMLSVEGNEARLKGMTEQFFAHFLKGPAKRSAAANKR